MSGAAVDGSSALIGDILQVHECVGAYDIHTMVTMVTSTVRAKVAMGQPVGTSWAPDGRSLYRKWWEG